MAEALQQKIEEKRKEKAALQECIQAREWEKAQIDERSGKIDNFKSETAEHEKETEKLAEYNKTAKDEVDNFPTDAQILKLERRLQSLQNQMREGEANVQQRETGIQAYEDRLKETTASHKRLHEEAQNKNQMVEGHADGEKNSESLVVSQEQVHQHMDFLISLAEEREAELSSLQSQLVEAMNEESERSSRIRDIQEEAEAEGPRIEAQKEKDCAEIQAAWDKEHKFLQQTYDRLYDINKEQQYHLGRGTHIKAKKVDVKPSIQEDSLSHRQSRLAQDINEAQSRFKDVGDDLKYNQKQTEAVRNEGRKAHADFKAEEKKKLDDLEAAASERQEYVDEALQLRQAKAELQQLLSTIRDS